MKSAMQLFIGICRRNTTPSNRFPFRGRQRSVLARVIFGRSDFARWRCRRVTAECGILRPPPPCPSPARGEGTLKLRGEQDQTQLRADSDVRDTSPRADGTDYAKTRAPSLDRR